MVVTLDQGVGDFELMPHAGGRTGKEGINIALASVSQEPEGEQPVIPL